MAPTVWSQARQDTLPQCPSWAGTGHLWTAAAALWSPPRTQRSHPGHPHPSPSVPQACGTASSLERMQVMGFHKAVRGHTTAPSLVERPLNTFHKPMQSTPRAQCEFLAHDVQGEQTGPTIRMMVSPLTSAALVAGFLRATARHRNCCCQGGQRGGNFSLMR